jgi:hypothetical protein
MNSSLTGLSLLLSATLGSAPAACGYVQVLLSVLLSVALLRCQPKCDEFSSLKSFIKTSSDWQ